MKFIPFVFKRNYYMYRFGLKSLTLIGFLPNDQYLNKY